MTTPNSVYPLGIARVLLTFLIPLSLIVAINVHRAVNSQPQSCIIRSAK